MDVERETKNQFTVVSRECRMKILRCCRCFSSGDLELQSRNTKARELESED